MNCTMMTPSLPFNMLKQVIASETTQLVAHACITSPHQPFVGAFGCIQIEAHFQGRSSSGWFQVRPAAVPSCHLPKLIYAHRMYYIWMLVFVKSGDSVHLIDWHHGD